MKDQVSRYKTQALGKEIVKSTNLVEDAPFDLQERTYEFARDCRALIRRLPKDVANFEDAKQLARASGSVAANYIEAGENLGERDQHMRLEISRKEAKESMLFLRLIRPLPADEEERRRLIQEASELNKILSTIVNRTKP